MTFGRPLRRWLSACTVFALLFMQVATLAHACPLLAGIGMPVSEMQATAMPCAEAMPQASDPTSPDLPVVCVKHCQPQPQGVDAGPGPVLSAPLVVSMLLLVPEDESAAGCGMLPGRRLSG